MLVGLPPPAPVVVKSPDKASHPLGAQGARGGLIRCVPKAQLPARLPLFRLWHGGGGQPATLQMDLLPLAFFFSSFPCCRLNPDHGEVSGKTLSCLLGTGVWPYINESGKLANVLRQTGESLNCLTEVWLWYQLN